jgi:hypothetical protein
MKTSKEPQTGNLARLQITGLCAMFLIALLGAPSAVGQPIFSTGFEPDTYLADTPLVGQDSWIAPPPFSPNAAIVSADKPRQGKQSVHVLGEDLVHQDFINELTSGYYDAIGSYRRPVNYDTANAQTVRIAANVRIDGPQTATGNNFFSASVSTRAATIESGEPSTASVGELAISSDGHAYAYSGNENVPTFLASVPVTLGQWHSLAIVANFATRTSSFYVDDVLLITIPFDASETFTGVLLRGTLLAYSAPDTATNQKADYAAHYDKFAITVTGK